MPAVKTDISVAPELLARVDELAAELKVSRSEVLTLAVEELARHRESLEIRARLDAAHPDESEIAEERETRRAKHRSLVEGEW